MSNKRPTAIPNPMFGFWNGRLTTTFCGSKGIRTPDPLHAMQVRYQAAPWTHIANPDRSSGKATAPDYYRSIPRLDKRGDRADWQHEFLRE